MSKTTIRYHILALLTILVWGTTFTMTKILLNNGLTPVEILCYRFAIAYLCIIIFFRMPMWSKSLGDEFKFLLLGLCGGSLYFLTENTALEHTYSSNVALILSVTPLVTALLTTAVFRDQHFTWKLGIGSLISVVGVCCIIINSNFIFKFNIAGDGLALCAALSWAVYSVLIKPLTTRYPILFITRKVFFYGLATTLPMSLLFDDCWHPSLLTNLQVAGNLLFLGIVASLLCFFSWNLVLSRLSIITANNYMYTQPAVSLACGALILGEDITWIALTGGIFIIFGIYIAERGFPRFKKKTISFYR